MQQYLPGTKASLPEGAGSICSMWAKLWSISYPFCVLSLYCWWAEVAWTQAAFVCLQLCRGGPGHLEGTVWNGKSMASEPDRAGLEAQLHFWLTKDPAALGLSFFVCTVEIKATWGLHVSRGLLLVAWQVMSTQEAAAAVLSCGVIWRPCREHVWAVESGLNPNPHLVVHLLTI
jgi:hypothetical protein